MENHLNLKVIEGGNESKTGFKKLKEAILKLRKDWFVIDSLNDSYQLKQSHVKGGDSNCIKVVGDNWVKEETQRKVIIKRNENLGFWGRYKAQKELKKRKNSLIGDFKEIFLRIFPELSPGEQEIIIMFMNENQMTLKFI